MPKTVIIARSVLEILSRFSNLDDFAGYGLEIDANDPDVKVYSGDPLKTEEKLMNLLKKLNDKALT